MEEGVHDGTACLACVLPPDDDAIRRQGLHFVGCDQHRPTGLQDDSGGVERIVGTEETSVRIHHHEIGATCLQILEFGRKVEFRTPVDHLARVSLCLPKPASLFLQFAGHLGDFVFANRVDNHAVGNGRKPDRHCRDACQSCVEFVRKLSREADDLRMGVVGIDIDHQCCE
jgi:hypothetical protein